ncbi:hypothetical protein CDD83_5566 [Cordyceps sp. RAO-2017]|nr:hypothetical protein CDD83_5566 [Cordyceps sp. RAO-2017]
MESMPTEIIRQICKHLCFHCQQPAAFPNADSTEVRDCKSSLSRLCGTSRRICAIAQPVLYHYYATGNLPTQAGFGLHHTIREPSEDDKLPLFLRTMMQRPDLAAHVRALQLVDSDMVNGCCDDLVRDLGVQMRHFNIQPPDKVGALSCGDVFLRNRPFSVEGHRWLEELAIALSPRLEMLLVAHTAPSRFFWNANISMSQLKSLAIRGYSGQYYFSEATSLIAAAPKLQTLYLLDCSHFMGWRQVFDLSLELVLANLRQLIVNGLRAEHLEKILRSCSRLQDLEYYQQTAPGIWNVGQVVQSIMPARHTLRRLYFACLPMATSNLNLFGHIRQESGAGERTPNYVEDALTVSYDTSAIESLREFGELQELGIDQASIYSPSSVDPETNPGRLARLLPPRVQKLRVMYVYRGMTADLCSLGRQAAELLPALKHIRLGQAISLMPKRRAGIDQMSKIRSIARTDGESICVSWTIDKPGADARTRIPGGTVHPQFTPCPVDWDLAPPDDSEYKYY